MEVKYPNVNIKLVGEDDNAFLILGRVTKAMSRAGLPKSEINAFQEEAMSGNYLDLLQTVMRWVATDMVVTDMNDPDDE